MSTAEKRAVRDIAGAEKYHLSPGRIAILLAAYNGARYLEEQLESLRNQTLQDFVCFIHDDGSTDGTQEIASAWCSRYPEQFVYMGSSPTGGAKYNFLYMLRAVEADYVMFCDQDDVWLPEKIEKTRQAMRQAEESQEESTKQEREVMRSVQQMNPRPAPPPVCVFSDLCVVDADLQVMNPSFFAYSSINPRRTSLRQLLFNNVAPGCTMMLNAPLRRLMLAGDVADQINMHDWLAMLLAAAVGKIVLIDEPLICYRQHEDNVVGASQRSSLRQKMKKLLQLKAWYEKKQAYLADWQKNAKAVLLCLETGCRETAEAGLAKTDAVKTSGTAGTSAAEARETSPEANAAKASGTAGISAAEAVNAVAKTGIISADAYVVVGESANAETNTATAAEDATVGVKTEKISVNADVTAERVSAAKEEIWRYIRRLDGPFLLKLVRFYAAKWSGR